MLGLHVSLDVQLVHGGAATDVASPALLRLTCVLLYESVESVHVREIGLFPETCKSSCLSSLQNDVEKRPARNLLDSSLFFSSITIFQFLIRHMPHVTVLLHVALYVRPQNLLLTVWASGVFVLSKVLDPDVPLAVGLVGKCFATCEARIVAVLLLLAQLIGRPQQGRCNRGE